MKKILEEYGRPYDITFTEYLFMLSWIENYDIFFNQIISIVYNKTEEVLKLEIKFMKKLLEEKIGDEINKIFTNDDGEFNL